MWNWLKGVEGVAMCHSLHFLQMACEKLCKAHLYDANEGADDGEYETSHGYTSKNLHLIVQRAFQRVHPNGKTAQLKKLVSLTKQLASEVCYLSPAIGKDGNRPDNCEYPWPDGKGGYIVPTNHDFRTLAGMIAGQQYAQVFKMISNAIDDLL